MARRAPLNNCEGAVERISEIWICNSCAEKRRVRLLFSAIHIPFVPQTRTTVFLNRCPWRDYLMSTVPDHTSRLMSTGTKQELFSLFAYRSFIKRGYCWSCPIDIRQPPYGLISWDMHIDRCQAAVSSLLQSCMLLVRIKNIIYPHWCSTCLTRDACISQNLELCKRLVCIGSLIGSMTLRRSHSHDIGTIQCRVLRYLDKVGIRYMPREGERRDPRVAHRISDSPYCFCLGTLLVPQWANLFHKSHPFRFIAAHFGRLLRCL